LPLSFAGSGEGAGAGVGAGGIEGAQYALPPDSVHLESLLAQFVKSAHLPESQLCIMLPLQRVCPLVQSAEGITHAPSWQTAPFAHMSVDHLPPSVQNWTTFVESGWQRASPEAHSGAGACRHCPFRQNSSLPHASLAYQRPSASHWRNTASETHSRALGSHSALLTHQPLLHTSLLAQEVWAYQVPAELHSR
jgi:hypothetical protein